MATDILIRLRKTAEDLATVEQYSGYVRMLIEACAEIARLRSVVRKQTEVSRIKSRQKGARNGPRSRVFSEAEG